MSKRLKKRFEGGVPHVAGNNKKNKIDYKSGPKKIAQRQRNSFVIRKRQPELDTRYARPTYLKDVDNESMLNKIGNFIKKHNKKLKEAHDKKR